MARIHFGATEVTFTRRVDVVCPKCHGSGEVTYGSTATWRGGIGGAAMTSDVCDKCWGSGDEAHPWTDLREQRATFDRRVEERVAIEWERSLGAGLASLAASQRFIAAELDRVARKRKVPFWTTDLASVIAKKLRALADAREAKGMTEP
jgi:hypothetical protein